MRVFYLTLMICLIQFNGYAQSFPDCTKAIIVCDKSPFYVRNIPESGIEEITSENACFSEKFEETNVLWLKWEIKNPGILGFTISPNSVGDDIDFALFRLENLQACNNKTLLSCSASGPALGSADAEACLGATGLKLGYEGKSAGRGCTDDDNTNFLAPVETKAGEFYALFIHNYRSDAGIALEWSGTADFNPVHGNCSSITADTAQVTEINFFSVSEPFPNPAENSISISVESSTYRIGQVAVISSAGYVEQTQNFSVSKGVGVINLDINRLNKGIHLIRFRSEDGYTRTTRFIKL